MELLQKANPTVLELLYSPEDCIVTTSPQFELLKKHRDKFLTKACRNSFGGYAVAQIKKARGLDKKMNWEKERVERKTPLDFVYAYLNGKTVPVMDYLELRGMKQENCGLIALDHMKGCYALYYQTEPMFNGIVHKNSNEVLLSSVPKGLTPEVLVYFNKDAYSIHCKDYKEYSEWLEKRNMQRYVDIKGHEQQIDGKNLMHCRRLLDTAKEIALEGTINVRRSNAKELLAIRRGEVSLERIIDEAEKDIKELDVIYENCSLPLECDMDFVNELLLEIRYMR